MATSSDALTHTDASGNVRMVDVGDKNPSERRARARAVVRMSSATARMVAAADVPKGNVIGATRLAGIMAAKRTAELIPLCHSLELDAVDVAVDVDVTTGTVEIVAEARCTARTGVEMEAMVGAAIAALNVYDMVKGVERGVTVDRVELLEKTGGRNDWKRNDG